MGGRYAYAFGSMPAGVSPDFAAPAGRVCARGAPGSASYGFQNFPPVTSSISTLYDWYRSSTVPTRGMEAGERDASAGPAPPPPAAAQPERTQRPASATPAGSPKYAVN